MTDMPNILESFIAMEWDRPKYSFIVSLVGYDYFHLLMGNNGVTRACY